MISVGSLGATALRGLRGELKESRCWARPFPGVARPEVRMKLGEKDEPPPMRALGPEMAVARAELEAPTINGEPNGRRRGVVHNGLRTGQVPL